MEHPQGHSHLKRRAWSLDGAGSGLVAGIFLFLLLGAGNGGAAKLDAVDRSGDRLALDLRGNVVRVTAALDDGSVRNGFGFIVGERRGTLYIVTANHVVRSGLPGEDTLSVTVRFFDDPGRSHQGELLDTYLPPPQDLGVVRIRKPDGVSWEPKAAAAVEKELEGIRGTEVWFVGRAGDWYVPTLPGRVNSDRPDLNSILSIDINTVMPGTSGAPLIGSSGIIGMIIQDEAGGVARAVSIQAIRRAVEAWRFPWGLERVAAIAERRDAVPSRAPPPSPPHARGISPETRPEIRKPSGGVAVFPLDLQQDADRFVTVFKSVISEAIRQYGGFTSTVECYRGTRHSGIDGEIDFDKSLEKRLWVKKSWLSLPEPDAETIQQLGSRLGVDAVFLFSAVVRNGPDLIRVYLVDVPTGSVFFEKGQAEWVQNDLQDTVLQARSETGAIAAKAIEAYRNGRRQ
ncbi:MAG: S1 family peptidase [Desulfobacterales bacterium]